MIEPAFCFFIVGTTARMPRKQPSWLTLISRSTSARSIVSTSPNRRTPALFTSTLTGPQRDSTSATSACHDSSDDTSWWTKTVASPSSAASASPGPSATSAMATRAPSATKPRTIAAPCPCAPPVTIAILSSSRPMSVLTRVERLERHHGVRREAGRGVSSGEEPAELGVECLGCPRGLPSVEPLLHDGGGEQRHHAAVHDEDLAGDALGGR